MGVMMLKVFYLTPNRYGGWATFTAHLLKGLRAAGYPAQLYRVGANNEARKRDFGYGEQYTNVTLTTAVRTPGPKLISAVGKRFRYEAEQLAQSGAWIVAHDPTELKNLPKSDRFIVIRQTGLDHIPQAQYIPHPYVRHAGTQPKTVTAVSTARIDFDKNTDIIVRANQLLPPEHQIQIYGENNRIYEKMKLMKEFPDWDQTPHRFSREWGSVMRILEPARYSVDMSVIKGDGGGTQYTFMEAWDAGAVPVIHRGWLTGSGEMRPGGNCVAVETGEELAEAILQPASISMIESGQRVLKRHDATVIAHDYWAVING